MVSQSNQDGWDGSSPSSRAGSLLSLDGGRRPAPAKTPPSYYDAVRSRHSLSQPRPAAEDNKQLKYNSLPRPLPQRYPPTPTNGHPWPEDTGRAKSGQPWSRPDSAPRQLYESQPKPANHVPLQVHGRSEMRYLVKRSPELAESPRANGGGPWMTPDCPAPRGNPAEMVRQECTRPPALNARSPTGIPPGGGQIHSRVPLQQGPHNTNSLPRRDPNQSSGLLRRCYTMTPDGSPVVSPNYPTRSPPSNAYEPRYSKSGKLGTRPLSRGFESRPMPPPAVQLRTGPLGSYPDAETLKRCEMSSYNRNYGDFSRAPSHGDISQQIYVETDSYTNGQSAITDHLAIPYRIPQVSPPKDPRPVFDGCNGTNQFVANARHKPGLHKDGLSASCDFKSNRRHEMSGGHALSPPKDSRIQPISPSQHNIPSPDYQSHRIYDNHPTQSGDHFQGFSNQTARGFSKQSPDDRNHAIDNGAIYANHHQMSFHSTGFGPDYSPDHRSSQKRSPNRNGGFYENRTPKNCPRDVQETSVDDTALYANQYVANVRQKSSQQDSLRVSSDFQSNIENTLPNARNPQRSPHPVVGSYQLPQPPEMTMVTETRGWNGQVSSYPKEVVKPTPRLPRLSNVGHLASVPAYQCVINELSSQNSQQPRSSDSSTLSLRSGYDSSSSSVRDYGRQPSKSDSSMETAKISEGELKSRSEQRIDKTFLSASMTSLCSDASSSVSTRRYRLHQEDPSWDRMNEEFQKRKEKGSVFSASPWEREEKEKLQREQVLGARRARDQEIALLESMQERSEKQEEWLRILRLEREFQRRAEQEDEESEDDEKAESFPVDKSIPNERLGLKLLDELLENSHESPTVDRQPTSKNTTQMCDQKCISNVINSTSRSAKPPVPAPRPSKAPIPLKLDSNFNDPSHDSENEADATNQVVSDSKTADLYSKNLSQLGISDMGTYHHDDNQVGRDYNMNDNWLIEVDSFGNTPPLDNPQEFNRELKEESRIYENIAEFQGRKQQNSANHNGYESHTLPKSSTQSITRDLSNTRISHVPEKKFPAMGVSSTLSRRLNGHVPSDNDILPALYASSKVRNGLQKEVPSELEDKSPEFKKLWISRPEKLTFQDKIRKFSLQAGEEEAPRDRVKNSRAQREIEIKFNDGQRKIVSTNEN